MLKWYYFVLLGVVAVVALSMTWWSMYDLGVSTLSIPVVIAMGVSLIFDIGGICLGILSILYARTSDSGFWPELWTFAFISASAYIVIQHGIIEGYPDAGIFMFAAAPVILGIIFKMTLNFLNRQHKHSSGRITEKLPSVGWLTWIRYRKQTWNLMSVAMRQRIVNAADRLDIAQDKHNIFEDKPRQVKAALGQLETKAQDMSQTTLGQTTDNSNMSHQLSQPPVRQELTSSDKPVLPVWLPVEPDMKAATLVRTCVDNGVFDLETIYRYAQDIKGQDVNKGTLRTELRRKLKTQ